MNLTGVYASCEAGIIYEVPRPLLRNTTVNLASKPDALADQDIFAPGVSSFQADQNGCNISQVMA